MLNFWAKVLLVIALLQSTLGHDSKDSWILSSKPHCVGSCPPFSVIDFFIPHVDCTKFCQCVWGEPVVLECGSGTHFNPDLGICDWPETNVKVISEETTDECDGCIGACPKAHLLPLTPPDYLAHEDCNKFCQCIYESRTVMECPSPQVFNPKGKVCEWPHTRSSSEEYNKYKFGTKYHPLIANNRFKKIKG